MAQKIKNCLWFDTQAEEAANFYASIFKDSKIKSVSRYGKEGAEVHKKAAGSAMTVEFELNGQEFLALNAGPQFRFNESISLVINCEDQKEVDYYWSKLTEGGQESMCGWLKDKFGLSWQVTPVQMKSFFSGDPVKAGRAMNAMLKMKKLDIAALQKAHDGDK